MSLRIGFIGCGTIAKSQLKGFQELDVEVTAVTDVVRDTADAFVENAPGAEYFDSVEALLASGKVDAVSVCTPPVVHEEAAVPALERGIHVFCEKPLAHSLESGRNIAAAAQKSKAVFMPAFRHRFLPAIRRMREMIADGAIGAPVFFDNMFAGPNARALGGWFTKKSIAGGGVLLDTCPHSVDLFRYILGEVETQSALVHRHIPENDVEDAGLLTLKGTSGALASLRASWTVGVGGAYIRITGTEGALAYEYRNSKVLEYTQKGGGPQELEVEASNGFAEETKHFVDVVEGRAELEVDIEDAWRSLEIIVKAYG
jgi:predicted dehydrogenase